MLIKQAIKILLLEDAGLNALVGNRIFPLVVPQKGPFPLIAWGRTGRNIPAGRLASAKPDELLITDSFEFVSVATGPGGDAVSEEIDDVLFELLHGWAGIVSDDNSPADSLVIQGIFHNKLTELYRDDIQQFATRSLYHVHFVRPKRP